MKGFWPARMLLFSLLIVVLSIFLAPLLPAGPTLDARAQGGFSNASIQGTYALFSPAEVRATVDGSVLSLAQFDGQGSWTTSTMRNTTGTATERLIETFDSFGSYDVDQNGMATAVSMTAQADGSVTEADFDFVITHTETQGSLILAAEFYAIPRLSSTGKPSSLLFKRLPDQVNFSNADLQGTYAFTFSVGPNISAGLGVLIYNGAGTLGGQQLTNTPAVQASGGVALHCFPCLTGSGIERQRQVGTSSVGGSYAINSNGSGTQTMIFTSATDGISEANYDLLITQAQSAGGSNLVTEFIALQREPEGAEGELRTLHFTRLSD